MDIIAGTTLALLLCGAAAGQGMDRERVFYLAGLIATASYYVAFADLDGLNEVMLSELAIAAVFVAGALAGFRRHQGINVIALAEHGVMDVLHHDLVQNTGVPHSWPGFCVSFDVTAAALVALAILARARGERQQSFRPY
jgi:hypothetical protein